MRFLVVSDIHGDEKRLKELLLKDFDYILILGDLTNGMREKYLLDLLPENSLFVPGNNERLFEGSCHGEVVEIGGIKFACIGGSLKTPFNTLFELEEEDYYRIGDKLGEFDILLAHNPPYGVLDRVRDMHVGSKAIRELIEEREPLVAFVGHIHEFAGTLGFVKRTPVINPGPAGFFFEL